MIRIHFKDREGSIWLPTYKQTSANVDDVITVNAKSTLRNIEKELQFTVKHISDNYLVLYYTEDTFKSVKDGEYVLNYEDNTVLLMIGPYYTEHSKIKVIEDNGKEIKTFV